MQSGALCEDHLPTIPTTSRRENDHARSSHQGFPALRAGNQISPVNPTNNRKRSEQVEQNADEQCNTQRVQSPVRSKEPLAPKPGPAQNGQRHENQHSSQASPYDLASLEFLTRHCLAHGFSFRYLAIATSEDVTPCAVSPGPPGRFPVPTLCSTHSRLGYTILWIIKPQNCGALGLITHTSVSDRSIAAALTTMKTIHVVAVQFLLLATGPLLQAAANGADAKPLSDLRSKAERGDASSQNTLGAAYLFGESGVEKDPEQAAKWFRKAADQSHAPAQENLGACLEAGQGVTKDYGEALKWYRKAADQNQGYAQAKVGWFYENGLGVSKDVAEAVKWYRKAAALNDPMGQNNLGACYAEGKGVPRDVVEAVKWYRKAAEQNERGGQFNLGYCYYSGQGVARDYGEAVKWYRKAADQNHVIAQWNLIVCYKRGLGAPQDDIEAYKWLLIASANGHEKAKQGVTMLEREMTREQVAEGKKRAKDFKPRNLRER